MNQEIIQLLPDLYTKSPETNIFKAWSLFAEQMDEIDSVFADFRAVYDFENQNGVLLDLIGQILREKRNYMNDDEYRANLFIAVKRYIAIGSIEDINDFMRILIGTDFICVRNLTVEESGSDWGTGPLYQFYLDGTKYLDGSLYLSGDVFGAARFEIQIAQSVPFAQIEKIHKLLKYLKAPGMSYRLIKI